jgi:hypothetical protein
MKNVALRIAHASDGALLPFPERRRGWARPMRWLYRSVAHPIAHLDHWTGRVSGTVKLCWGLWLAFPAYAGAPQYAILRAMVPWSSMEAQEATWGLSAAVLGALHLYAISRNDRRARLLMLRLDVCLYVFLGIVFVLAQPSSGGWVFLFAFAASSARAFLRLANGLSDEE